MFQEEFKQPMQVVQTDLNNTDSDCEGESSYKARKLIEEESGGSMQMSDTFAFRIKKKHADDDEIRTP